MIDFIAVDLSQLQSAATAMHRLLGVGIACAIIILNALWFGTREKRRKALVRSGR
jgi:cyd operon protein YbgT